MTTADRNVNVSVIILLYNADPVKLERTIKSIIIQKAIHMEIILSDDGSMNNPRNMVESIFQKYQYRDYKFNRNETNSGTVKNILSALELSSGKYVYLISPGDMLFDENTMKDFFDFAEKNHSLVCFGDYVPYNFENDQIQTFDGIAHPPVPSVFEYPHSFFERKVYALLGSNILGPAFFREKNYCVRYFNLTSQSSKYVEDNTSIVYSLAENIPLQHYSRKICWYEQGSGISTNGNGEWQRKLDEDFIRTYEFAKKLYPQDKIIDAAYIKRAGRFSRYRKLSLLLILIKHPIIFFTRLKVSRLPYAYTKCSTLQAEILKRKLTD